MTRNKSQLENILSLEASLDSSIAPLTPLALQPKPLSETSIRNLLADIWLLALKADNLTAICKPIF
jgi:hypothetical protein